MVTILLKMTELSSERFASTGATTFVGGTYRSVSVTVERSTSITYQGSLTAGFVTVENKAIVRFESFNIFFP